jgi:hypothetical protein
MGEGRVREINKIIPSSNFAYHKITFSPKRRVFI